MDAAHGIEIARHADAPASAQRVLERCGATVVRLARVVATAVLLVILPAARAPADGGLVRAQVEQGPLAVTLFTSPTPLRVGDADVSVMVQDVRSREPLLDAAVEVRIESLDADATPMVVALGRDAATNKLLQAAIVRLPAAGRFRLIADVRRGDVTARAAADVTVAPAPPALLALWPYLALPPVVVGMFLVQQWLRRRTPGAGRGMMVAVRQEGVVR